MEICKTMKGGPAFLLNSLDTLMQETEHKGATSRDSTKHKNISGILIENYFIYLQVLRLKNKENTRPSFSPVCAQAINRVHKPKTETES